MFITALYPSLIETGMLVAIIIDLADGMSTEQYQTLLEEYSHIRENLKAEDYFSLSFF